MKRLNPLYAALLAATAAGMLSTPAWAATATGNFNVVVLVNPACQLATGSTRIVFTFTGTGGTGLAVLSGSPNFTATCTDQLRYTLSLDGTETSSGSGLYNYAASPATFNLAYSLQLRDNSNTNFGTTSVRTGTGNPQTYNVLGAMANNQTPSCTPDSSGGCGVADSRTVTVTY